jgi:hypothetical protein
VALDEQQLLRTVTRVVNTLRANDIPFALAGGCAVYAHGGPASDHDVDVFVTRADAVAAQDVLIKEGMLPVDPPEDWLLKVYDDDVLVDIIFRPNQCEVTYEQLADAVELRVGPAVAPVLPPTAVIVDKLLVLEAHRCDFTPLLPIVRALREQVDWPAVARETVASPYARTFLRLVADLNVIPHPNGKEPTVTEHASGDAPQYSVAHIQQAFAEDPRSSELGIQVTVRGSDAYLSGVVSSEGLRADLEQVLREHEPGLTVHNEVQVVDLHEPRGAEDLR